MMESGAPAELLAVVNLRRFTYVRVVSSVIYGASLLPSIDTSRSFLVLFMSIAATEAVAAYFLRKGLRKLSFLDSQAFGQPALLVRFYLLGAVVFALAGGVFFSSLGTFGVRLEIGQLGIVAGLVGIGGLIGMLIGSLGAMQGLWRTGERYNRTSIKLGTVFFLVPYVNIASDFLLLVGIRRASANHW